jgi:hypothetical protein
MKVNAKMIPKDRETKTFFCKETLWKTAFRFVKEKKKTDCLKKLAY